MTLEKIKEEFVDKSSRHLEATLEGDSKTGNKLHSKLMKLYEKIKRQDNLQVFLELLKHPNEGVRLWAATFSLTVNTQLAIECLKDLTKLDTITALTAETTLKVWQEGELELL